MTLPKRWFRRRASTATNHRVYAIGDIHGRLDLFREMVERLEADNAARADSRRITLVILGDLIDRGPSSKRLVRMMMATQARSKRLVVLLGNHEATLLACIDGDPDAQDWWLRFGGLATLESFGIDPPGVGEDATAFGERLARGLGAPVVEWLSGLPLSISCGDYFFCHAGVRPGRALHRQKRDDLLWIREPFLTSRRGHGAVVVHGHSRDEDIVVHHNRIGLDTNACASGVLSAICLDGREAWRFSSDPDDWRQPAERPDQPARGESPVQLS